ncbi:MAG TPA: creatininase family protein [Clostridiaceae bacterium]|nr:creatininase family protein [Clostridiaceae bacterium]
MLNSYSTAVEIRDSHVDTAILPIGSTEQHGPHLPIATDSLIAEAVAKRVAGRLGAFLLPVLPVSTCQEHMISKGSVGLGPDTFYYMIRDIVLCLKRQGFKTIILIISHGGVFMANPTVRELNATNPDIRVIKVDLVQFINSPEISSVLVCKNNLHACEFETSLMLFLKEELVRKDKIADCEPDVPRDYLNYGNIFKYSKTGVWGKPSLATKEKGERIMNLLVDLSIDYINKVKKIPGGYGGNEK